MNFKKPMLHNFFAVVVTGMLLLSLLFLLFTLYHVYRWAKFEADAEMHRLREEELKQELQAMKRGVKIDCYTDYREHGAQNGNPK